MTDIKANLEINEITIAATAQQCLESFATCLAQASAIHPREFSRVEDQAARFSTWASGTGVFAPGRASMDHRLRYSPEVQSIAIGLLDSLNHRVRKCSDTMDSHGKNPKSDVSALMKVLEQCCINIASEISHLIKLSNMIRRASKEHQALKMRNFQVKDEDKDIERTLLDIFKRYISDKFPRASEVIQQRLAEAIVLRRKQILYRRHRQEAATKLPNTGLESSDMLPEPQQEASAAQVDPLQEVKQKSRAAEPVVAPSEIQSATTLQLDKFIIAATSPSVGSAMTIALSDHENLVFPTAPGANAKQKYEQLKQERIAAHKTLLDKFSKACPDDNSRDDYHFDEQNSLAIAKKDLEVTLEADIQALEEIICPYCLEALPAIEVFDNRKWRKHVTSDLDPYVCLFEECSEADELYKHSEKWLSHMHQHNQRWRCPSHRELDLFLTREDYMQHMREAHNFKLGEKKLLILANRNIRKATKLFTSCPLCGESKAEIGGRLESHIAGHLRSLALKFLPPYADDTDTDVGSDRDGCDGSQLSGVRTTDDLSTDKSSSADGVNDELSKLSETQEMDFLNDALGPPRDQFSADRFDRLPHFNDDGDRRRSSTEAQINSAPFPPGRGLFGEMMRREPPGSPKALVDAPAGPRGGGFSGNFRGRRGWRGQDNSRDQMRDREIDFRDRYGDESSDYGHADTWNSLVKPTLQQLQQSSDKDPLFHLVRGKAEESHSLPQTLQQQQQQQPSQSVPHKRIPFPPLDSADQNPPCNTLYVGNLPIDTDEEELKAMFAKQRGYKRLAFRTKGKGPICFVEFEDASSATRAMHELYGSELHNSTKGGIRLSFSKNPLGVRSSQPSWKTYQPDDPPTNQATFYRESVLEILEQQALEQEVLRPVPLTTTEGHKGGKDFKFGTFDSALGSDHYYANEEISTNFNSLDLEHYMATDSTNKSSVPSNIIDPSSEVDDNGYRQDGYRWCCKRWYKVNTGNFSKHLISHTPLLLCKADPESCVKRFSNMKELHRHYLVQHRRWAEENYIPGIGRHLCEACGMEFTRLDNKRRHIRAHPACLGKIEQMKNEEPRAITTG